MFGRFRKTCRPVFKVTEFRSGLNISFLILFSCLIKQPFAVLVGVLKMHTVGMRYRSGIAGFTSTQVFLGFPVSISKRSDGSQHSKLPLHASHVALQT